MLRSLVLGAVSAIALISAASAADMYRAEPMAGGYKDGPYLAGPSWTGFYVGVNGGYAWGATDSQFANTEDPFGGLSPAGGFGGGQIGYNWQGGLGYSPLVIGIEADLQGAGIEDSAVDGRGAKYKSEIDWFGTVRGRLGYSVDRTLVYATGGFAYGNVNNRIISPAGALFRKDETATGWVAGGGVEYKVNPAWSVKAEYQYINLGENEPVNAAGRAYRNPAVGPVGAKVEDDAFHTVRVGLNYKVGGAFYEPLK